jgi:DNA-binding response OmpR family regulator
VTPVSAQSGATASILVVDDDRRVVDLLTIALAAYGYRVLQAADGDEALRVAARERPDLVVLDVRLPKRSGFEVCEHLRQDPDDPQVPIIMVSAAVETESRLQGLSRGADDYVAKPFSPKELIARIKRLLIRSAESRAVQRRGREVEHDLTQAREDAKRSHAELRDEQRLRELTHAFARDFHGLHDSERLYRRLLLEAETHLGSAVTALLCLDEADGAYRAVAVRGDGFARVDPLVIRPGGELATLLSGLGRPARRRELQRFPELHAELTTFVAAGVALFAPLRDAEGLVGVLVAGERFDGLDLARRDLEVVTVLCETAALALRNAGRSEAQAEGMLDALEAMATRELPPACLATRAEAAIRVAHAAAPLPPALRKLTARAVRLGDWPMGEGGARVLSSMAARDSSTRLEQLARLLDPQRFDGEPDERTAACLVRVALAYAHARDLGLSPETAVETAITASGSSLDEPAQAALRGAWTTA